MSASVVKKNKNSKSKSKSNLNRRLRRAIRRWNVNVARGGEMTAILTRTMTPMVKTTVAISCLDQL